MDIDDEEDFYEPEPSSTATASKPAKTEDAPTASTPVATTESKAEPKAELEEGEEEDEEGAMDEDDDSDSVSCTRFCQDAELTRHSCRTLTSSRSAKTAPKQPLQRTRTCFNPNSTSADAHKDNPDIVTSGISPNDPHPTKPR